MICGGNVRLVYSEQVCWHRLGGPSVMGKNRLPMDYDEAALQELDAALARWG